MPLKPLDFYILVVAAHREREIDRAFEAKVHRELGEEGLLHDDGTLNIEAIIAGSHPFDWSEYDELRHDA